MKDIDDIRNHLDRAKSIEELMGMEGNIRKGIMPRGMQL